MMTGDGVDIGRRVRVTIARELVLPLSRLTDSTEFRRELKTPGCAIARDALQREFGITLTNREVDFCQTVGTLIDVVRSKVENGAALDVRRNVVGR